MPAAPVYSSPPELVFVPEVVEETLTLGDSSEDVSYYANEAGKIVVKLPGIILTMPENTFIEVDLDKDGMDDTRVTTKGFKDGKPVVIIEEIVQPVLADVTEEEPALAEPRIVPEPPEQKLEPVHEKTQLETKNNWRWLAGVIGIVLLAGIIFLVYKTKK